MINLLTAQAINYAKIKTILKFLFSFFKIHFVKECVYEIQVNSFRLGNKKWYSIHAILNAV